jgi:rRNA-processing protein FCF1
LVTKVGCGRAGHKVSDIAPLFINAYCRDNILLPKEFCEIIETLLPPEKPHQVDDTKSLITFDTFIEKEEKDIVNVSSEKNPHENVEIHVDNDVFEVEKPKIEINVVGRIDLSKYEKKRKEIKADCKNIYIIDTNIFVECPNIISKISNKFGVVLSAKVIDELDKLKIKLDNNGRLNVQKALRLINATIGKRDIKMEYADPSLLPDEFDKKSPDNLILSVALKFKNDNPILLTSDNGLQIKAKMMNISTISLKDFLN